VYIYTYNDGEYCRRGPVNYIPPISRSIRAAPAAYPKREEITPHAPVQGVRRIRRVRGGGGGVRTIIACNTVRGDERQPIIIIIVEFNGRALLCANIQRSKGGGGKGPRDIFMAKILPAKALSVTFSWAPRLVLIFPLTPLLLGVCPSLSLTPTLLPYTLYVVYIILYTYICSVPQLYCTQHSSFPAAAGNVNDFPAAAAHY